MANGILGHKFQQRRIAKIVSAFKHDVLMRQIRMTAQMFTQTGDVARVEQFDCSAKGCVFNTLMVRQIQPMGQAWCLNMPFQPGPTWESMLAGDGELSVAEA